jgi:hypothetical protein
MTEITEYFVAFCSGVGALGIIIGAVVYTIKREISPVIMRIEALEERREEDQAHREAFEKRLLDKLDKINENLNGIKRDYVHVDDLEKQQKICPARMRAMKDITADK